MLEHSSWQVPSRWRGEALGLGWWPVLQPSLYRRKCSLPKPPGLNTLRTSSGSIHPYPHLEDLFRACPSPPLPRDFCAKKEESTNDFQCLLLVADSLKQLEINQRELLGSAPLEGTSSEMQRQHKKSFGGFEIQPASPKENRPNVFLLVVLVFLTTNS